MSVLVTPSAEAAGEITVDIPYEQLWFNYSDNPDVDDTFTYQIVGETADTVMPLGSDNGVYYFTLEGNTEGTLNLQFPYTDGGEYTYFLSAYVPEPQTGYTYEPRTFKITVFVHQQTAGLIVYAMTIQDEELSKFDVVPLDPSYIGGIRVEIPYYHEFHNNTGDPTVDATFWYVLTPVTDNCPMPEGTVDGQYIFAITGSVEDMLYMLVDFTEEGTYVYEFKAYVPNPQEGYTYDDVVYQIEIVIGRTVNSLVLESMTITDKSTGKTVDKIEILKPAYDAVKPTPTPPDEPKPDTPKTGDETKLNLYAIAMGVSAAAVLVIAIFLIVKLRDRDSNR